jgi:hypothetical protein
VSDASQNSSGFLFASARNQLSKCGFEFSGVTPASQVRPLGSWRRRSVGIQVRCEHLTLTSTVLQPANDVTGRDAHAVLMQVHYRAMMCAMLSEDTIT